MFVYVIKMTFDADAAVKAFYDPSLRSIIFSLLLDTPGAIGGDIKGATFGAKIGDRIEEHDLSAAELLALITANDQARITVKMPLADFSAPETIAFFVVVQALDGTDTRLSYDDSNPSGTIKVGRRPDTPRRAEVLQRLITLAAAANAPANTVDVVGEVRLFLDGNNGGDEYLQYNIIVTIGHIVDSSYNNAITAADIARGYIVYNLSQTTVPDGHKIMIAYALENRSNEQSKMSLPHIFTATIKPQKASFLAESGKMDDANFVYILLKIKYDLDSTVWNRVNIMSKASGSWAVADYFARTEDTDKEMMLNGFVEYKLKQLVSGTDLSAFSKVELAIQLSNGTWSSTDKATQSERSEPRFAVSGAKKFIVTHATTSAFTAQPSFGGAAAKHTITKTLTFTAPPVQVVVLSRLLQNGVEVDAKSVIIATNNTTASVSFDRLASLVKTGDKFEIVSQAKVALENAIKEFLPSNTKIGEKAALLLAEFRSDSVLAQPDASELLSALIIRAVDDAMVNSIRKVIVEFELTQLSNDKNYPFESIDLEVASDAGFVTLLQLTSGSATRLNIPIDSNDPKKLDEVLVIGKFVSGTATSFAPNTLLHIRYRSNHKWLGGGSSVVNRPWKVLQYVLGEEDQPNAPAALTAVQEKVNTLKFTFAKAVAIQHTSAATDGAASRFEPANHKFSLINEIGQVIRTLIVKHEESAFANVDARFTLEDSELDQFVRVKHLVQYLNSKNVSVESDATICAEIFVAKKLSVRSIQVVETSTKIKVLADIDSGRLSPADIAVKAVFPHRNSSDVDEMLSPAFSFDALEKRWVTEHTKQPDPQGLKYGNALKVFLFASGSNGQLVNAEFPTRRF